MAKLTNKRDWQGNGDVVMHVDNLSAGHLLKNITFDLHRGEILGIAGLLGAGRTELMNCLFGILPKTGGAVYINGEICEITKPSDAVNFGIGYVPEDRKLQGLFMGLATRANISASNLGKLEKFGFVDTRLENALAREYIDTLSIKVSSLDQKVDFLSGGNQQKALLARWLAIHPKVILLDDPTRGIDVGARAAIHQLIYQLVEENLSVIFVSSELPEVMDISDRILVLARGQITGEFSRNEVTKEKILTCATLSSLGSQKIKPDRQQGNRSYEEN